MNKNTEKKLERRLKEAQKRIRELENKSEVAELRNRLKSLEEAIDSSEDLIISLDTDYTILFINQTLAKYLSVDRNQIIGKSLSDVMDKKVFNKTIKPKFKKVIQGNAVKMEMSYDFPAMGKRYLSLLFSPHKDMETNENIAVGVLRDITDRVLMENKIKKSQEKYRELINSMNDTIWVIDFDANFIDVNDTAAEVLGYSKEELLSMGPADIDFSLGKEKIKELVKGMKSDEVQVFETSHTTKDGRVLPVEISSSLVSYRGETAILSIARDITRRKKAEENLLEERNKLEELHKAVDQLQRCDTEDKLWDRALRVITNILRLDLCIFYVVEKGKLVPKAVSQKAIPEGLKAHRLDEGIAGKTLREQRTIHGDDLRTRKEAIAVRDDLRSFISIPIGKIGVLQIYSTQKGAFSIQDMNLVQILAGHLREEVARIRLEEKLKKQTIQDPLTGLFNRRYFNQFINKEVNRIQRYNHFLGFLMIDVNKFKEINERYSHMIGDKVLMEVARLLKKTVRDMDFVVRYGGDEFLIILPETDGKTAKVIIKRIRKKLKEWNKTQDLLDFPLTLAIGVSHMKPGVDEDIETALKKADRKMYEDKKKIEQELI
ncbi:MAG: diguanylate cyclase [Candidatus Aminicenantes bacterium]